MSTQSIVENNGQQAHITTDISKIFIWNNRYETGSYTNDGYDEVILAAGTLMGRISATEKLVPLASGASDGSQFPVGILNESHTIDSGDTKSISICVYGDVAKEKVILSGSDTMATVISNRTIADRIAADTVGIKLVTVTENTATDNQ